MFQKIKSLKKEVKSKLKGNKKPSDLQHQEKFQQNYANL